MIPVLITHYKSTVLLKYRSENNFVWIIKTIM